MTLNGHYALHCTKDAPFDTHHDNLNEARPILSATMTILRRYKFYVDIRGDSLALAALAAIDKVGPTVFVRALTRALPLGYEAKKVKSPWSIVLLS